MMEMINNIIHSDVFNYLKMVDNDSVDLLLTDPPYGIGIDDWDIFESEEKYFEFIYEFINL